MVVLHRKNKGQQILAAAVEEQERAGLPVRICNLKARQYGGSTAIQSYLFHQATTRPHTGTLTVGMDGDNFQCLHAMSRFFLSQLPAELRPMVKYDTKNELRFANPDAKVGRESRGLQSHMFVDTAKNVARADSRGAVGFRRGQTFKHVHMSECAFWPNARKLRQALFSAVQDIPGTSIFMESTANLYNDDWHRFCKAAANGENGFKFVFVPWYVSAEYVRKVTGRMGPLTGREQWLQRHFELTDEQICWRRFKIAVQFEGDEEAFIREYPEDPESCFTLSGNSVFSSVMKQARAGVAEPRICGDLIQKDGGQFEIAELAKGAADLHVFEYPKETEQYAIGADVAEGLTKDGDFSAAVVGTASGEVVATIRVKEPPSAFAETLKLLGSYYHNALICCERNNHGIVTIDGLIEGDYSNLYMQARTARTELVPGWFTTEASKSRLISRVKKHLQQCEKGAEDTKDERIVNEMGTFVKKENGHREADTGETDDMVMAYGLMLIASEQLGDAMDVAVHYMGRAAGRSSPSQQQAVRLGIRSDDVPKVHRMGIF